MNPSVLIDHIQRSQALSKRSRASRYNLYLFGINFAMDKLPGNFFRPSEPIPLPSPPPRVFPSDEGPVYVPNINDVLSGRGGRINAHPGNIRFRQYVQQFKARYLMEETKNTEKAYICAYIVSLVRSQHPPGRFLKRDDRNGLWIEIGDIRARQKTGQALREDATEIRQDIKGASSTKSSDSKPEADVCSSSGSSTGDEIAVKSVNKGSKAHQPTNVIAKRAGDQVSANKTPTFISSQTKLSISPRKRARVNQESTFYGHVKKSEAKINTMRSHIALERANLTDQHHFPGQEIQQEPTHVAQQLFPRQESNQQSAPVSQNIFHRQEAHQHAAFVVQRCIKRHISEARGSSEGSSDSTHVTQCKPNENLSSLKENQESDLEGILQGIWDHNDYPSMSNISDMDNQINDIDVIESMQALDEAFMKADILGFDSDDSKSSFSYLLDKCDLVSVGEMSLSSWEYLDLEDPTKMAVSEQIDPTISGITLSDERNFLHFPSTKRSRKSKLA